jgi:hypothetical protein
MSHAPILPRPELREAARLNRSDLRAAPGSTARPMPQRDPADVVGGQDGSAAWIEPAGSDVGSVQSGDGGDPGLARRAGRFKLRHYRPPPHVESAHVAR